MKKMNPFQLTTAAFCVVINIVGALLGLLLKLPVYLDNVGTILAGALLGPFFGGIVACLSGIISGITSDIYALYFIPGAALTGIMAGLLFRTQWLRGRRLPVGVAFLTLPGAIVSACTAAFVFDGVTSAGSSLLVQILRHMGLPLVSVAFVVQFITEYFDRLLSVALVALVVAHLNQQLLERLTGKKASASKQ